MDPASMAMIASALIQAGGSAYSASQSKGDSFKKKSMYDKNQKAIYGNMTDMAQGLQGPANQAISQLQEMMNPDSQAYQNFAAPHMRQFQEQTLPGIAEHFAGGGALSSSGFGQALSSAGAGLQEKLASLKSGLQQSALEKILEMYGKMSQNSLNASPFAYVSKSGGVSPSGQGINAFTQSMTPGNIEGIMNMFSQKPGASGAGYQPQFGGTQFYDQQFRQGGGMSDPYGQY